MRKFGDHWPLNVETDLDRYQNIESFIELNFNDMKGANIFCELDPRSGYHQMALWDGEWSNTSFWGAQRILKEWCLAPFGLTNAPPQRQMDKVLVNLPYATCHIDDFLMSGRTLENI